VIGNILAKRRPLRKRTAPLFPAKSPKKEKKTLDSRSIFAYIIGALRRQQVGSPVNPAEDINIILIVFVPLRLVTRGISF
jgi:hypothetical protein